jgi:hypothetical protein
MIITLHNEFKQLLCSNITIFQFFQFLPTEINIKVISIKVTSLKCIIQLINSVDKMFYLFQIINLKSYLLFKKLKGVSVFDLLKNRGVDRTTFVVP